MTDGKGKVLITGVAGFLGSNLLDRLIDEGYRVTGIDNFSMGRMENIHEHVGSGQFHLLERDVTRRETFAELGTDFDCVVHLAAFKIPRYGKALDTLKINYLGTENTLEFARRLGCKCVLASTSDVYGRNPTLPFSEDETDSFIGSSKSPRWAYAVSKLFDEHMGLAYQDEYGFPVTILRFFGSYGPKQHLSWWGGPPPVFIDAVLHDRVIPIHGDGQQTRSFTYVQDTVDAIFASIIRSEANGEIINVGSNEEISILDLAKVIKRVSGTPGELKIEFVPYESFTGKKYQDVMRRVPDTSHCYEVLGVKANIPLEEGITRTILWQKTVTKSAI